MPLYQVAILQKEKVKDKEVVEEEKIIVGVTETLAADPQGAMITTILKNKVEIEQADQKRLEVIVRPFH
ncbi:hypothetical protein ES703_69465 [subsurface metagenome]